MILSRWPCLPLGPSKEAVEAPHSVEDRSRAKPRANGLSLAGGAETAQDQAICATCSAPFRVPKRPGAKAKFCSDTCRAEAKRARERHQASLRSSEPEVVQPIEPAAQREPAEPEIRACAHCGEAFSPKDDAQRFCTKACKTGDRENRRGRPEVPASDPPRPLVSLLPDDPHSDPMALRPPPLAWESRERA
jgi:hypothetical protein